MSAGGWDRQKWRKQNPTPPWECWYCGDPIYSKGQKSWSLAIHHINGFEDRESLAPVHYDCHNKLHGHSNNGHSVSPEIRKQISNKLKGQKCPWVSEANKRRVLFYVPKDKKEKS